MPPRRGIGLAVFTDVCYIRQVRQVRQVRRVRQVRHSPSQSVKSVAVHQLRRSPSQSVAVRRSPSQVRQSVKSVK